MAKNDRFIAEQLSFEDFERTLNDRGGIGTPVEELLREQQAAEEAARKKEARLKKAYQQQKRKGRV